MSSLLHGNVRLEDPVEPALLARLDGRHQVGELPSALGRPAPEVHAALERFAALLVP